MTTETIPDTERCHTWHANRYLTGLGLEPEDACTCCDDEETTVAELGQTALNEGTAVPVEYLYGSWTHEDADGYIVTSVRQFPITKKTPKRIFYDAGYERTRSVDRQTLEQTGSVYNRSAGWWAPDYQLFANRADAEPPPPETPEAKVKRLRAAMAALHPDRGGDPAAFRAAYDRYQKAVTSHKAEAAQ